MSNIRTLTVQIGGAAGPIKSFEGRYAWTLDRLIKAGETGITTLDTPAPRLSHYIFVLRRAGLNIETREEFHGGVYKGRHGRYVLRSSIKIVERRDAA